MTWVMFTCYSLAIPIFSSLSYYIIIGYTDIPLGDFVPPFIYGFDLNQNFTPYLVVFLAPILAAASVSSFYLKRNPNVKSRSSRLQSIAFVLIYACIGAFYTLYNLGSFLMLSYEQSFHDHLDPGHSDYLNSEWAAHRMAIGVSAFTLSLLALLLFRITNYPFKPAWFDKFYYWGNIAIGFILCIAALLTYLR
jgi:hypothetical protein